VGGGQIKVNERLIFMCDRLGLTEERRGEERRGELSHDFAIYSTLKTKKPISMRLAGSVQVKSKGLAHTMVPQEFSHLFFA